VFDKKGNFLLIPAKIITICTLMLVHTLVMISQVPTDDGILPDEVFSTKIVTVIINQDTLSEDELWNQNDGLVMASSDTLIVVYGIQKAEGISMPENVNYLYRVSLGNKRGDESVRSLNQPSVSYINLPEEDYLFSVSAFDIRKEWITSNKELVVRVDDKEKLLRDSIIKLEYIYKKALEESESDYLSTGKKSVIPFAAGIIFTILVSGLLYILVTHSNRKKSKGSNLKAHEIYKSEPYLALLAEKERLEKELQQLRGQISGMESRSQEIRSKNRELEDKVSKLTEYKDNLEQLQEQKDDLFAVIIHDIKNPVGIIKNLVELLRSFDLTASEQQEIMEDIVKTTQTIVSLSHEVSRVLALEGGRMTMNYTVQDLQPLVQEIVQRNIARADKKSIELELMQDTVEPFSYDAMKVYEVVDNLVSNAIKFTQVGGAVRVKTYQKDNDAVIEIADNGLGLSEDDLQKAFKKGSQLSARPTGGESSTGLGLWIVKKLVEAHDGRVSVKSTLGQGSTFSVLLPTKTNAASPVVEM